MNNTHMRIKSLYLGLCTILSISASVLKADEIWKPSEWPVLKTYDSKHIARIALPLGGIGTGTVSLRGRDGNTVTNNWKGDIIPLGGADKNRNTFREEQGLKGIYMDSEGVEPKNQAWGTVEITPSSVLLAVIHGTLTLKSLGIGEKMLRKKVNLKAGESVRLPFGK